MTHAKTRKQFQEILEELAVGNRAIASYIKGIPHDLWAWYVLITYFYIFIC